MLVLASIFCEALKEPRCEVFEVRMLILRIISVVKIGRDYNKEQNQETHDETCFRKLSVTSEEDCRV